MRNSRTTLAAAAIALWVAALAPARGGSVPERARDGMVVSQNAIASQIGADVLAEGGTAVDAAVATAFALAVTHPTAGNIGGGGFIVYRPATADPIAYDFREMAPSKASPDMFLRNGEYDSERHHDSHLSVGVPGTVAGLHLAWSEQGKLPWPRLVSPAIALARDGFVVTHGLARSLADILPDMQRYPASVAQFSKNGAPYEPGDLLRQPDLARTLERIAAQGPRGFYEGETAALIEKDMRANGGLVTREDLKAYRAKRRAPLRGTYRGYEVISMPPISSGGTALIEMLNILEGYNLKSSGFGSAETLHLMAEAMRRAYADRARHLGDPDFNPAMPIDRLTSKAYAAELRNTIHRERASKSSPSSFEWTSESPETTHLSIVDRDRNAVALTYTLEYGYGSRIVVPGGGFLLNNEMGDFNAGPGLTNADGLIGTEPNLAQPGKRMLSSMTPTILAKDGRVFMVTGSPGGRTIINTVLQTILNVVDHGMNVQEAIDAPRIHHQWLPDRIVHERVGFSPDTLSLLEKRGHTLHRGSTQGVAEAIVFDAERNVLEAAVDRRAADGGAAGVPRLERRAPTSGGPAADRPGPHAAPALPRR
jgi:gamma-glutamyltranspeptidase/glutathione hydrolase